MQPLEKNSKTKKITKHDFFYGQTTSIQWLDTQLYILKEHSDETIHTEGARCTSDRDLSQIQKIGDQWLGSVLYSQSKKYCRCSR